MQNTLIVITGPTGVGKTDTAIGVAKTLGCEIISADSRQIYRQIPITTAAPTPEEMAQVKHHFVAFKNLDEYYSAAQFEEDVMQLLPEMFAKCPYAVMCGGSMMYIDAVCNGIDDIPTIDEDVRRTMKRRYEEEGLDSLLDELRILDPEHCEIVDKKNPRRVIHALEICHQTGKPYSSFRRGEKKKRPFGIIKIGLSRDREELYERINSRVIAMMQNGLEEEARRMLPFRNENSLNTVGYKELFQYFDGIIPLDEAVRQIQSNSRRYARKQMTWYKRDEEMTWFHPEKVKEIIKYIDMNI